MTTRELIKQRMTEHTDAGNVILSQSLCGVGGVQNTVSLDDKTNLVELPISDSSNPGIAVGFALAGRMPVYIIRFGGNFGLLNFWSILSYASKAKELWNIKCPMFVRIIGAEGSFGPVASNPNYSIPMHYPGVKVLAPLTSSEWDVGWNDFLKGDGPVICCESRNSYNIEGEIEGVFRPYKPQVNIFAIGPARLEAEKAKIELHAQGIFADVIHIYQLKPLWIPSSRHSDVNIVVDSDYTICGAGEHVAYELETNYGLQGIRTRLLGLEDKSAGFAPHTDNITPSSYKIVEFVKNLL